MKNIILILAAAIMLFGCAGFLKMTPRSGGSTANQNRSSGNSSSSNTSRSQGRLTAPVSYNVAYSYRTDRPDQLMSNIPRNIDNLRASNPEEYILQVTRTINSNSTNDFDRVKKAHDLVALLVNYDAASFLANRIPNQSYQNVLRTRLAVCEGYANLFKRLMDELKIPCIIVHGYARGVGSSVTKADTPNNSNHAWNIVTINNASYLIDTTWDSGFLDGRTARQRYRTDYLFIKPEHLIYSHFPANRDHQLLSSPLSASQFSSLPPLKPRFFIAADKVSVNLQKVMRVSNSFSFQYTVNGGYYLSFQITETRRGRELNNRSFVQRDGSRHTAYVSLPAAGQYLVSIFMWEQGGRSGESCGEFILEATSASRVEFPATFSSSASNLELLSPIEMPLQKGRTYTFSVRVDNKRNVAIISGNNFTQLTRGRDGVFSAEYRIPNNINELSLGVADSDRGRYEFIATYRVE